MRNFLAKHLVLFANAIICYGDDHLMFSFICVKEGNSPFSEIAPELGLNIRCQGSATLISIFLNLGEFPFLLTSEKKKNTPEVKTN